MAYYGGVIKGFGTLSGPVSKRQPPFPPVTRASAIHGNVRRKRIYVAQSIFVVDDEPVIACTLAEILKLHGYSARAFTSSLEALAAARLRAPDLLISDVAMPGLSGVDLAIQMRLQHPGCKVLLFSGQAATWDFLEDARRQGHDFQLLEKPVHPSTTLSRVATLQAETVSPRLTQAS
jgi:CheY-like chemotaxis protein